MTSPQNHTDKKQFTGLLRSLGAVRYDLLLPETKSLPSVLHPTEKIAGLVYGRYHHAGSDKHGRGVLVATNQRVLLLDKKPLFLSCNELTYDIVSAVEYSKVGAAGTVTLHTRMGDIHVRTLNKKSADNFVEAIEANIFKED